MSNIGIILTRGRVAPSIGWRVAETLRASCNFYPKSTYERGMHCIEAKTEGLRRGLIGFWTKRTLGRLKSIGQTEPS